MKYVYLIAIYTIVAGLLSYFDSKFEKLSPPGKYTNSFRANFIRNLVTIGAIVLLTALIRIWF